MIVIDCSIPKPVALALRAAQTEEDDPIYWLAELLPAPSYGQPQDTKDVDWIGRAGREGWIVISNDYGLLTRPSERRLMIDHQVAYFCTRVRGGRNLTKLEYMHLISGALPAIQSIALTEQRPFFYAISRSGALRQMTVTHPDTGIRYPPGPLPAT